ncbi:MAG: SGNH/GDSL hydrolase family protein [Candidatus Solibacter sp.]
MNNKLTLTLTLLISAVAANAQSEIYLALGDSVPFGMNPLLLPPYTTTYPAANKFVGYPEVFADLTHLPAKKLINAACPGETSASFLNQNMPDLGCNTPRVPGAPPFKTVGLHSPYTTSQMDFANLKLAGNSRINLVSLMIGANDVLMVVPQLQQCGADQACANAVLGPVLQAYAANLGTILTNIRRRYQGTLVLTKYYSPAPALDSVTVALNTVMTQVAHQLAGPGFAPVQIADGFTAFKIAAFAKGGDACAAGLLIRLTPTECDQHPNGKGQEILAFLVLLGQIAGH